MVFRSIQQNLEGQVLAKPILVSDKAGVLHIYNAEAELTKELVEDLRRSDYQGVYVHGDGDTISEATLSCSVQERTIHLLELVYEPQEDFNRKIYDVMDDVTKIILNTIKKNASLFSMVSDLSYYDDYTYGHCLNVSALAMAIGLRRGLNEKTLSHLGMSGILHDIGKQNIPISIINKPGRLSAEEIEAVRCHPLIGYDFAKRHRMPEDICLGILQHHEKFNGGGYPYNLRGDKISLFGRILAVADVFDALTHKRSYHDPMSVAGAVDLMAKTDDFDPDILLIMEEMAGQL